MSKDKFKAIYGTRDILPEEADRWTKIITTVAQTASIYNYKFINPPIFEATELFARGIGESSDVVTKEMYTFRDLGDRSLTLRPEGTASVVRAYIEHSLGESAGPLKVWYAGPMFRQERPQAGRYRQFYQFGVEAIGSLDPFIDAEVIALNFEIMRKLKIKDPTLHINSIGMPEDRESHKKAFTKYVKPNLEKFCADCRKRFELNPLRMFDCKNEKCISLLNGAPEIFDFLSTENREHFGQVREILKTLDIPFILDKRLVRGLDYYTRTAWEIKSRKLGAQDSVSGGGRYDLLVEQLGGRPTPGIGFAAGIERILLAQSGIDMKSNYKKDGFYIVSRNSDFNSCAFQLAIKIRKLGFPADIDYLGRSLKAQMKQADKSGFKYSIILAEDEMKLGMVVIRDMAGSMQAEIPIEDIWKSRLKKQIRELIAKIRQ